MRLTLIITTRVVEASKRWDFEGTGEADDYPGEIEMAA